MMAGLDESRKREAWGTPELRELFGGWLEKMEGSVVDFVGSHPGADTRDVARQFGISKGSAQFLINKAAQEGKLKFSVVARAK